MVGKAKCPKKNKKSLMHFNFYSDPVLMFGTGVSFCFWAVSMMKLGCNFIFNCVLLSDKFRHSGEKPYK